MGMKQQNLKPTTTHENTTGFTSGEAGVVIFETPKLAQPPL